MNTPHKRGLVFFLILFIASTLFTIGPSIAGLFNTDNTIVMMILLMLGLSWWGGIPLLILSWCALWLYPNEEGVVRRNPASLALIIGVWANTFVAANNLPYFFLMAGERVEFPMALGAYIFEAVFCSAVAVIFLSLYSILQRTDVLCALLAIATSIESFLLTSQLVQWAVRLRGFELLE